MNMRLLLKRICAAQRRDTRPFGFSLYALCLVVCLSLAPRALARPEVTVERTFELPGQAKPIWVSLSGFSGEALSALQFDLYVQGFNFTNSEGAQYVLSGSNNGSLTARAIDNINKHPLVAKAYTGGTLRRQVHLFVDEFVQALQRKPICLTQIAFKGESGPNGEIFVSDFDGHNAKAVTSDRTLVAAPCFVPGRLALYYTSYKLGNPDIFYHNLSSGERTVFARFGGSNISPAASPDGSQIAMILSKDGWTDLYVQPTSRATPPRRLTKSPQDESSPCWSPDGRWICYASKDRERRALRKISPSGGEPRVIPTAGLPSPTEPDWSPDGKWIAFTAQFRAGFEICVVSPEGGNATQLVEGEDPAWAPNSRTLAYARRQGGHYVLALLDVPTKQVKDVSRISGISSQSQPSWAR